MIINHKLEEDDLNCDVCQTPRQEMGYTSKEILKYQPAQLYIEEHRTFSYRCVPCEKVDDKANIITTKAPATLLHKSMASDELDVVYQLMISELLKLDYIQVDEDVCLKNVERLFSCIS